MQCGSTFTCVGYSWNGSFCRKSSNPAPAPAPAPSPINCAAATTTYSDCNSIDCSDQGYIWDGDTLRCIIEPIVPSQAPTTAPSSSPTREPWASFGGQICDFDADCINGRGCDMINHVCNLGNEHDVCEHSNQCTTNHCNHKQSPKRCDNRVPGSFMANCDHNEDCQLSKQNCYMNRSDVFGEYGTCKTDPGRPCRWQYECAGTCDCKNGIYRDDGHCSKENRGTCSAET